MGDEVRTGEPLVRRQMALVGADAEVDGQSGNHDEAVEDFHASP